MGGYPGILRILTATLAAAFTLPALADIPASRVPAPVKEQVQKQYPNAGAIEWDFDNDEDVYEAEFHLNGLEYEVKLYPDGTVSLVKADISLQHLPAPVTAAIARDFPGYALRRAGGQWKNRHHPAPRDDWIFRKGRTPPC